MFKNIFSALVKAHKINENSKSTTGKSLIGHASDFCSNSFSNFDRFFNSDGMPTYVNQVLTYDNVISYFISNRPNVEYIKGVLLFDDLLGSTIVAYQFFTDRNDNIFAVNNNVIIGRIIKIKSLENELLDVLDGNDFLVVE